jgi:transcriptional regulator with XRE-family HTH domain
MNPIRAAREQVGLSQADFGQALGYGGTKQSRRGILSAFENGHKPAPIFVARLAEMFRRYGVPKDFMPEEKCS